MKIHVPSMLAIGVETINKHNKQTMAYKIHKTATKSLENIKTSCMHYRLGNFTVVYDSQELNFLDNLL